MYNPTPRKVKNWLLQYMNIDTGLYNLEAVTEHQIDEDAPSISVLYFATRDNNSKLLSADMYNKGNSAEVLVKKILANDLYKYVNEVNSRFRKMDESEQRDVVRQLLATYETKTGIVTNRILSALNEMTVGEVFQSALAIEHGYHAEQNAWYDIEPARKFAQGEDVSWKATEYFTREIEEYLASLGL